MPYKTRRRQNKRGTNPQLLTHESNFMRLPYPIRTAIKLILLSISLRHMGEEP